MEDRSTLNGLECVVRAFVSCVVSQVLANEGSVCHPSWVTAPVIAVSASLFTMMLGLAVQPGPTKNLRQNQYLFITAEAVGNNISMPE